MSDRFSFVNANLRVMKNHRKNKGAPLGGMGGMGGAARGGEMVRWLVWPLCLRGGLLEGLLGGLPGGLLWR